MAPAAFAEEGSKACLPYLRSPNVAGVIKGVHAQREESYVKLQCQRHKMQEDRHLLQEHEREHGRLLKVAARSDMMAGDL
ncbi:hypothetical protein ACOMHN_049969 [Nucella lapillus]